MGNLSHEVMCLRFFGDDLDPRKLFRQLGVQASYGWRKGELWSNRGVGDLRTTGGWVLNGDWVRLGDINNQIAGLFQSLAQDLSLWETLTASLYADVFCGLFLEQANGRALLSPVSMKLLSARGLPLSMEIYEREQGRARGLQDWGVERP